jgi:hypothetical protein
MYRIELAPGEVTVFRTIEELATGVRNGLITPKARIYHSASDKWLPIEFHPHYKQALELNAGHASEAGGHKHAAAVPKHGSSNQASGKSGGSKPKREALTFLNVPLSPVIPVPKARPRVADLPYIEDDPPAAPQPTARPAHDHAPAQDAWPARPSPTHHSTVDPSAADRSLPTGAPVHDAPIERSPGYDLEHDSPLDHPPAHQPSAHHVAVDQPAAHQPPTNHSWAHGPEHSAPAHDSAEHDGPAEHEGPAEHDVSARDAEPEAPVHYSTAERAPAFEAAPVRRYSLKPLLADETPLYRPPTQRSSSDDSAAHAAFEAHLAPEPVRIEEPVREIPRGRLGVEELFAPPAPRPAALPPISASPVLELPQISYPEITPLDPPVAERSPTGSRGKRAFHLIGAVMLLAAGGYASTTVFSFGRPDGGFSAAATMADRPIVPVRTPATASAGPSSTRAARGMAPVAPSSPAAGRVVPSASLSPKASSSTAASSSAGSPALSGGQTPLPPASSGFAPALEPRAIVAAPPKPAPQSDAAPDSTAIAPAIDMQVIAPELQGAESLAGPPRQKSDSAMKRILRAVSGK